MSCLSFVWPCSWRLIQCFFRICPGYIGHQLHFSQFFLQGIDFIRSLITFDVKIFLFRFFLLDDLLKLGLPFDILNALVSSFAEGVLIVLDN